MFGRAYDGEHQGSGVGALHVLLVLCSKGV